MTIIATQGLRRTFLALVTAAALATATACAGSAGDSDDVSSKSAKLLDRSAAEQEYLDTTRRLTLPEGAQFPPSIPQTSEETLYERGFASSIAENYWICAWAKEWLSQRSADTVREAAALAMLDQAPQTEFMSVYLDDAGRRFFADYLTKARLGDPSGFQSYVSNNCES